MSIINVKYWRGSLQCVETATTYGEALAIADRNANRWPATFSDEAGIELTDDGNGLVYAGGNYAVLNVAAMLVIAQAEDNIEWLNAWLDERHGRGT